ncbi:MAG: glycoside-pentoside-hexuronide (GPH):cation symporter [Hyphomonadaceae bacterium]
MANRKQNLGFLFGYGVGDFGLNIYWNSLSLILVFWYADVVGLEPYIAGFIYSVGVFWDAISDPIIAIIAARNRSRHGAYRPFILYGGVGLSLSFSLLFWMPPLEGGWLIIHLCLVHMLFRTTYTLVAVPYAAMSSRLSFDSQERIELSGIRMMFAFAGLLVVSGCWFPLSRFFGNGDESSPTGFFLTAVVGAALATVVLTICFFATEEKTPPGVTKVQGLRSFLVAFRGNPALRVLLLTIFLHSAATASFNIPLAFFIEANEGLFAAKEVVMTAFALVTLVSVSLWTYLSAKLGRKRTWLIATALIALLGVWFLVFGPFLVAGVPVQIILFGVGFSAFSVLVWSYIPDTVEFGQYAHGERAEGAVFGLVLFVKKFSGVIIGITVGAVLTWVGYDASLETQEPDIATRLGYFLTIMPSILLILSTVVIMRLPLDRHLHAKIVDELSG